MEKLDTPALVIDLDKVQRNIKVMASLLSESGVALRPHTKAHKSSRIASMQLEAGASGICCSKLQEAEILAAAGHTDILVTTPIVGSQKVDRLVKLILPGTYVRVIVDDFSNAEELSATLQEEGLSVDCLIDVDIGQGRTGVAPSEAAQLAEKVAGLPGLNMIGIQCYEGHLQPLVDSQARKEGSELAMQKLEGACNDFRERGLNLDVVTTGGTGSFEYALEHPDVTEVQPGSYIFMDSNYVMLQGNKFENALSVVCSVISNRGKGYAIVDAGFKALSNDAGSARPLNEDLLYEPAGDEHGRLTNRSDNLHQLQVGEQVTLLPSHCDTTVNLYDYYTVVRQDALVGSWPIQARGALT